MSNKIEADNGVEFEYGFKGGDISKVMLGELRPIRFEEFTEYATDSMLANLRYLNEDQNAAFKRDVRTATKQKAGLSRVPDNIIFSNLQREVPLNYEITEHYFHNPFETNLGRIIIGNKYVVTPEIFYSRSIEIISGGFSGWKKIGKIPVSAATAINRLQLAAR